MSDASLAEIDDRLLMRRHVEGDAEAFGEIYRRHRDRMWAVAVGVCGDREIAAEAVQEGFVSAFRRAGSYRGDAAVTTWLHRIVVNACIDLTRKVRPTSELTDEVIASVPPAADATGKVDTRLAVHEALTRLSDEHRVALVLVDMHGLPVAEAAQILDIPTGTVKSRCSRGREALGKILAAAGVGVDGTSGAAASSDTTGHQTDEGRRP
ncbi:MULTISPECIES: RNA polymerase sigma factor SigM [Janibacter]|uniref:RNA polymerase sigma factor SigM n=1 Tax=Janibacter indicus TaxID=857417 RepID=A0A1L3MKJ0_9MICO|nr:MULTISPECIES: RNA polymerase sigma factor SigM [Janibacter]APH02905.1 RNA polymerase subunit sigma [Janibacter indicus]QNF94264.1 RNA polymerase sigma factor SigM [Janibacter sp. YB324]QOK22874.1 RNA polymerase sigma factor SigM [Janibacter indicus]SMC63915.1 RNA polymerase, sigma subunit, ECF family [Janibacter indicus]